MIKCSAIISALLCGLALAANVTIAINGEAGRIPLTPVPGTWKPANSPWAAEKGKYHLTVNPSGVTATWQKQEFGFIPEADGEVKLILGGIYRVDGDKRPRRFWAAYRKLAVTGAELQNGNFDPKKPGWNAKPWNYAQIDGEPCAVAWSGGPLTQTLKVRKGETVMIQLETRHTSEPADYRPPETVAFPVRLQHNQESGRAFLIPRRTASETETWSAPIRQTEEPRAELRMAFDDEKLYVRVEAADPAYCQNYRGMESWRGSGLRLAFDFLRNLVWRYDPREKGDYELGFSYAAGAALLFPFVYHTDYPLAAEQIGFQFQGEKEARQRYEITVPWRAVPASDFGTLSWFGLDYRVNHASGGVARRLFQPAQYRIAVPDKSGDGLGAALLYAGPNRFPRNEAPEATLHLVARNPGNAIVNISGGGKTSHWEGTFDAGENILRISLPGATLAEGENPVRIQLAADGRALLDQTLTLTVENPGKAAAELEENCRIGKEKSERLRTLIAAQNRGALLPRNQIAAAAIAELFLNRYIPEDLQEKRQDLALRESRQVLQLLDRALAELADGRVLLSQPVSTQGARLENGRIVNGDGQTLFLLSHHYIGALKHLGAKEWSELGVNFDGGSSAPHDRMPPPAAADQPLPQPGAERTPKDLRNFMERDHVAMNLILHQFFPAWFGTLYPEARAPRVNGFLEFDPDHPRVREFLTQAMGWAFRRYANEDAERLGKVLYFDLHNEPGFDSYTDCTRRKFQEYLKMRYGSIEELNRIWKMNFPSFDAIGKPHEFFNLAPVSRYDWNTFNNNRFYHHFAAIRDAIRANSGDKKFNLTIKLTNFSSWTPVYQPRGYDRERLMELTDLQGGDIWDANRFSGPYSVQWRVQSLSLDFCRSLAPEQPIVDSEYHLYPDGYDRMRSMLWLGAYQGLNGTSLWCAARDKSIWFWKPGARESGMTHFLDSVDTKPESFAGYTHAGLEIQHHADRLPLFYLGERPIALYYSQNSLNFEPLRHLSTLEAVYQAFYFQGVSLGFVTERMLRTGRIIPRGVKLLIVPDARYCDRETLEKFRELEARGVTILLIGDENLTRDTFDRIHAEKLELKQPYRWELPQNFDTDYAAISLPPEAWRRAAPDVMRAAGIAPAATMQGNGTAYVTTRFATAPATGQQVGYAVNLGTEVAEFEFVGADNEHWWIRDLDAPGTGPRNIIRLEPMKNINFERVRTIRQ